MSVTSGRAWRCCAAALMVLALSAGSAQASLFHHTPKPTADQLSDAAVAEIQKALDEQRLLDAGRLIDQALLAGSKDHRLTLLAGDLELARGRYADALSLLRQVDSTSDTRGKALEGEGIALSLLGRSDEALSTLRQAVTEDPSAWRAWNALAGEYDSRRAWTDAEAAYDHAIADFDSAAIVLNNRGFSRFLQNRLDAATDDFVAALQKKPDFAAARTNLRLVMAMKGEYDRAIAGGAHDDQAALLNNAGFAAMSRGDYASAEDLLSRAIQAKGTFYAVASDNLDMARSLDARKKAAASDPH